MSTSSARVPCTIVTGFLGAGKTTLIRHVLAHANGRRLAVIVNEFGDVGIDGEILKGCGDEACPQENIVELANGCLCCTVADDFVPALDTILARKPAVEHIVIETSGLALPKPLVQAFHWPAIKSRVTVDGVVAVVDGAALAEGRLAADLDGLGGIVGRREQEDALAVAGRVEALAFGERSEVGDASRAAAVAGEELAVARYVVVHRPVLARGADRTRRAARERARRQRPRGRLGGQNAAVEVAADESAIGAQLDGIGGERRHAHGRAFSTPSI